MIGLRLGRMPLPRVPSDVKAFRRDERATLGPEVQDDTQRVGTEYLTVHQVAGDPGNVEPEAYRSRRFRVWLEAIRNRRGDESA